MRKIPLKKILVLFSSLLIIFGLILLDYFTKAWATETLKGRPSMVLWEGVFQLTYVENAGMAFGLLQNQTVLFTILTIALLIVVSYLFIRTPLKKRYIGLFISYILLTAGGIGNFIDRLTTRYVVDFFDFIAIRFAVFNVADCYVTIAIILLLILLLFVYKDGELSELYLFHKKNASKD